jgi:hypothetical protein
MLGLPPLTQWAYKIVEIGLWVQKLDGQMHIWHGNLINLPFFSKKGKLAN